MYKLLKLVRGGHKVDANADQFLRKEVLETHVSYV